jgi:tRNA G18 (ribose-2'-O)-methylase SpoU
MEEAIYSDKIFVMDQGRIVMQGTPKQVFSQVEQLKELRLDVPQATLLAYELKKAGLKTAAMALTDDSISIDDPCLETIDKLAIVLGTEGDGLKENTITACDYTVKIPMSHGVDSLNVAAAGAVAFWQLRKK